MQITIDYESSWRNSFLDGNNNEALPKNGRRFVASVSFLLLHTILTDSRCLWMF